MFKKIVNFFKKEVPEGDGNKETTVAHNEDYLDFVIISYSPNEVGEYQFLFSYPEQFDEYGVLEFLEDALFSLSLQFSKDEGEVKQSKKVRKITNNVDLKLVKGQPK